MRGDIRLGPNPADEADARELLLLLGKVRALVARRQGKLSTAQRSIASREAGEMVYHARAMALALGVTVIDPPVAATPPASPLPRRPEAL